MDRADPTRVGFGPISGPRVTGLDLHATPVSPIHLDMHTANRLFEAGIRALAGAESPYPGARSVASVTVIDGRTCDVAMCLNDKDPTTPTIVVVPPEVTLDSVRGYFGTGVGAILASDFSRAEFYAAVAAVTAGGLYVHRAFVPILQFAHSTDHAVDRPSGVHFTSREAQVYAALCRAQSNCEIAASLGISPRTVRFHVSNILRKLEVPSRNHVIAAHRIDGRGGPGANAT